MHMYKITSSIIVIGFILINLILFTALQVNATGTDYVVTGNEEFLVINYDLLPFKRQILLLF